MLLPVPLPLLLISPPGSSLLYFLISLSAALTRNWSEARRKPKINPKEILHFEMPLLLGWEIGGRRVAAKMEIHACTWRRWTHKLVVSLGRYWFEFIGNSIKFNRSGVDGASLALSAAINCLAAGASQCGNAIEWSRSEWYRERTSHANKQSVSARAWSLSWGCTAAIYSSSRAK